MGLDQYLTARRYIGGWDHSNDADKKAYRCISEMAGIKGGWRCEGSPHITVEVCVAYWRKANQVHRWFVEEVQEGNDDCKGYYVSREKLEELRDLCKTVLASSKLVAGQIVNGHTGTAQGWTPNIEEGQVIENPAAAKEILPTTSGFFFGGTEYDQWYWDDLKRTVAQLDAALARFDGWDFEYRASW
jgi:hypothetical protein